MQLQSAIHNNNTNKINKKIIIASRDSGFHELFRSFLLPGFGPQDQPGLGGFTGSVLPLPAYCSHHTTLQLCSISRLFRCPCDLMWHCERWPLNPNTTSRVPQGHSLHQVWTLWDHSFLSYAADKQTDRQTDWLDNSTVYPSRPAQSAWLTIRSTRNSHGNSPVFNHSVEPLVAMSRHVIIVGLQFNCTYWQHAIVLTYTVRF